MIPPAATCAHGSVWYCTCPTARQFLIRRRKFKRAGLAAKLVIDATGTRRRLEGLGMRGHSERELAIALGCDKSAIGKIRRRARVHRVTAAKVATVCDLLMQLPEPTGPHAQRARQHAEQAGWWDLEFWDDIDRDPEPEAWDGVDETVVLNAAAGRIEWADLDKLHKITVLRKLHSQGMTFMAMAKLLGCAESTPQVFWRRHVASRTQQQDVA